MLLKTRSLLFSALLISATGVLAHTAWLEPIEAQTHHYRLMFGGHAGVLEPYVAEKLKTVEAFNADGKLLSVERLDRDNDTRLRLAADAALVALHFDNGTWSRDAMGNSFNQPMSEVPGAIRATRAPKYHKTVLIWSDVVTQTVGQSFELTPLGARQPVAGRPMQVKVTIDGQPVADVRLGHGEEGDAGLTDGEGIATFVPNPGYNKLWAGIRLPVEHADYTELSYEYLLGFEAL